MCDDVFDLFSKHWSSIALTSFLLFNCSWVWLCTVLTIFLCRCHWRVFERCRVYQVRNGFRFIKPTAHPNGYPLLILGMYLPCSLFLYLYRCLVLDAQFRSLTESFLHLSFYTQIMSHFLSVNYNCLPIDFVSLSDMVCAALISWIYLTMLQKSSCRIGCYWQYMRPAKDLVLVNSYMMAMLVGTSDIIFLVVYLGSA